MARTVTGSRPRSKNPFKQLAFSTGGGKGPEVQYGVKFENTGVKDLKTPDIKRAMQHVRTVRGLPYGSSAKLYGEAK